MTTITNNAGDQPHATSFGWSDENDLTRFVIEQKGKETVSESIDIYEAWRLYTELGKLIVMKVATDQGKADFERHRLWDELENVNKGGAK